MGAVADITKYVKPKLEEAEKRGIAEGMEKGIAEKAHEVALGMLKEGMSIEVISRITGLSKEEIKKLERR